MGRSVVSLVDDTFTRGTAHTIYHFYWHYLFTGAIWCTIWTSADCRARVTQMFNVSGLRVWNIDVMAGTKKVIKCLMQRVQEKLQASVSISWNTQKV